MIYCVFLSKLIGDVNIARRQRRQERVASKKVMRCKLHTRPVFSSETCAKFEKSFSSKDSSSTCENCKHSS